MPVPRREYMCLECGNSFEIYTTTEYLEEANAVECPMCGSTDIQRVFEDGEEPESGDWEDEDENPDEDEDTSVNLDDL